MNKIVAIVGMCGAGKSVASDLLEEMGYQKVYFGGVTMDKLKEANLEITPENEKYMREKLRADLGMGAYAIVLLPKIIENFSKGNTVLDGLYSWDELKILRNELGDNLTVIAVTADRDLRYSRLAARPVRPFTIEQAEARDIAEIENSAKGGPIAMADYYIDNNHDIETYKKRLLDIIEQI